MPTPRKTKLIFTALLAAWLVFILAAVYLFVRPDRIANAVVSMGIGLVVLWVFGCGALMLLLRRPIQRFVRCLRGPWQVKFVVFATLLAMLEEAITVSLTNLAPLFGVQVGEAYITASANYLDVILHHSVIVFIPMFIAWAWLLGRYRFSPFWVFLLFGISGTLAETVAFGLQNLNQFAMWIFVYGLMVFLPADSVPSKRHAIPPRPWHALLAILLPLAASAPVAILHHLLFPDHPDIHFPPIGD